ncbi:hypothetical protein FBZ99_103819 [Rhizobium sp. ERR 1071]|nr:hypothetical protein FBZ99_103819 [Rhizobium sp. ERR1071]
METAMGNHQSNIPIRAVTEIRASRCVQTSIPLWRYLAQRYLVNFCRREEKTNKGNNKMDHVCNLLWLAFSVALLFAALNRRLVGDYVAMWYLLVITVVTVMAWAGFFPTDMATLRAG